MAAAYVRAAKKLTRVKIRAISLLGKLCWRSTYLIGFAERLEEPFLYILSQAWLVKWTGLYRVFCCRDS